MTRFDHDLQRMLLSQPSTFPFIAVIISVSSVRRQVTEVISNDTEFRYPRHSYRFLQSRHPPFYPRAHWLVACLLILQAALLQSVQQGLQTVLYAATWDPAAGARKTSGGRANPRGDERRAVRATAYRLLCEELATRETFSMPKRPERNIWRWSSRRWRVLKLSGSDATGKSSFRRRRAFYHVRQYIDPPARSIKV